jgi:acetyltransferase-like isoleucine patch superfamily enzyme
MNKERRSLFQKLKGTIRPNLVIGFEFIMCLLFWLPRFPIFCSLKAGLLRLMGAKIGKGVVIYPGVWIMNGRNFKVGEDVDFSYGVLITTSGGVTIGDRVLIGYRTQILSTNHTIPPIGERIPISGDSDGPVFIGDDVWIGANCIILPGVTIGEGAVVAAGSVVVKDVPANSVSAGVPATTKRFRSNE